jgi:E3 ubiquitin-protein ligase RNF14
LACSSSGEEEGVLDLDSPWLAAAEAESRLEVAAMAAEAELGLGVEADQLEDEIRDNQQRREDEVWY